MTDEFFKQIAEAEQTAEALPSDRPIGTAARRGLSADASKAVQAALAEEEQATAAGKEAPREKEPDGSVRAEHRRGRQSRRVIVRAPKRGAVIAVAVVAAVGLTTLIITVLSGPGAAPTPSAGERQAGQLARELSQLRENQSAIRIALADERASRRAGLRRLYEHAGTQRDKPHRASPAETASTLDVSGAPTVPTGTRQEFGFERSGP